MSSTANQDSALEQLMTLDATLLDDASKFGPTDVLQLSHRLEAAVKLLSQAQASLDPDTTEVHDYVKQLVRCYVAASETAKIARGLEKSCMVQVVMSKCVHILVAKLCVLFTELSGKCPDQISREELDRFYITVKLSLQILQVFPEVKRSCWSSSSSSRHRHSFAGSHISAENLTEESQECLAQIMIGIFTVLTSKVGGLQLSDGSKDAHPSSTLSENRTSEIALIRSVISSASENIIVWDSVSGSSKQPDVYSPFLLRLFPLVCDMCDAGTDYQYWSFQLLSLWYRKLIVSLPALQHEDENFSVLGKGSKVLHETLQRLWVTWDSPVDGVSEFVVDTFRTLLDVWKAEVLEGQSDYEELAEELIVKVLQMPWHSRSRYKPLALLVPAVDTDKLLHEHPYLKAELLRCMGTSFLAALANDVYSAFLHSISQVRQKTCAYWLPATVKTVPYSGTCLQQHLLKLIGETKGGRNRQTVLFAWITTCRHVRSLVALDIEHLPQDLLVETIYNEEEEICAQAMSLLCGTQKKAEPLKEIEMELLQSSLPYCLKVDSAPFRQQLIASLRKLFVRVRDSCSTAIKRKTGAEFVDPSVDFMDWLYKFTMMNLFPGACFQRRRTCLDIIQAWLETVVFVPSDGAKKGKAQGPTDALLSYARCKGQWDLFSPGNRTFLLYCVTDGADEIQESATHILGKYFPWSPDEPESSTSFAMSEASTVSNISYASDTVTVPGEFATHLLRHGISLCNSPRAYENSSGALLVRIVYDKYVRLQGCRFEVPRRSSVSNISVKMMGEAKDADQGDVCATFFTNLLMKLITKQLQAAETDALNASKHLPIHGIMQALRECIHLEQESPGSICTTDWLGILETAITLATSVITYMLSLLAGGQTDSCPSFAEMGMALDELVASEEGRTEQEEDMSALKPEFQLLLSWSWLNLKVRSS
ncbi:hypothetical protein BaRGS_00001830 [Batillaria attramentaria]|uniref:tRNA (32-2'-O)-methyltransferase regulator THADA-like TPR repeats region domain-containing protein n=1 Tax=Batillaria attramentaria TaxID=370345 RepID=A0ABD0M6D3_9CAEN